MKKAPIGRAGPSGRDGQVFVGEARKQRLRVGAIKMISRHKWAAYLRDGRRIGTYRMAEVAASAIADEQVRLDRSEPAKNLERTMHRLIDKWSPHKLCKSVEEPMGPRIAFLLCWMIRRGGKELHEYLEALRVWRLANLRVARSKRRPSP